ncbi:hypothetical protein, partial [Aminobacter ciceronei]|uniref:hypothetical protein n=1 Tax=Aminobacter ciceronei TaxID=150723 RepID=UPI003F729484
PQKPQSTREINNLIHITTRNRQTNLDSIAPEKPPPGQNKPYNARSKDDSEPIHTANPSLTAQQAARRLIQRQIRQASA